jgi:hypothetical protein
LFDRCGGPIAHPATVEALIRQLMADNR